MNFTYTDASQGIGQGNRGEDEGFEKGNHNPMWSHSDQDVDAELQNGMTRMKINGNARD